MSYLLKKSELNKNAALFLHTDALEKCYASSVHCGYYSCLQKIIHLFSDYYETDYETVVKKVKGGKGGVHGHYIKEIGGQILSSDKRDAQTIRNNLTQLKSLRIRVDYKEEEITESMAKKAFVYTERIHRIIKKHFQL